MVSGKGLFRASPSGSESRRRNEIRFCKAEFIIAEPSVPPGKTKALGIS
jgi:hypothetical protein